MMSKKNVGRCAAVFLMGAALTAAVLKIKSIWENNMVKCRENEIKELISSIKATLNDIDVVDFESFSERLDKCYNIQSEELTEGEIQYSSSIFSKPISSNDIFISCIDDDYSWNMMDLEEFFEYNKKYQP